jgi:hypothetical protein
MYFNDIGYIKMEFDMHPSQVYPIGYLINPIYWLLFFFQENEKELQIDKRKALFMTIIKYNRKGN